MANETQLLATLEWRTFVRPEEIEGLAKAAGLPVESVCLLLSSVVFPRPELATTYLLPSPFTSSSSSVAVGTPGMGECPLGVSSTAAVLPPSSTADVVSTPPPPPHPCPPALPIGFVPPLPAHAHAACHVAVPRTAAPTAFLTHPVGDLPSPAPSAAASPVALATSVSPFPPLVAADDADATLVEMKTVRTTGPGSGNRR